MAKCDVCGKGVAFGNNVSHSHRRSNRTFKPNIQKMSIFVDNVKLRFNVCTKCMRTLRKNSNA
ncbi:MAG: 50S ribosomal protein L28 [Clostridiales bacterium]|jgi:large subunit ribosomal protein L28|nr:50S ribosomal protein L28 [Clostridiales bacterium]